MSYHHPLPQHHHPSPGPELNGGKKKWFYRSWKFGLPGGSCSHSGIWDHGAGTAGGRWAGCSHQRCQQQRGEGNTLASPLIFPSNFPPIVLPIGQNKTKASWQEDLGTKCRRVKSGLESRPISKASSWLCGVIYIYFLVLFNPLHILLFLIAKGKHVFNRIFLNIKKYKE